jgi:hypothetical protein
VIGFGVHQNFGTSGKRHNQGAFRPARKFEPEGFSIEFPGPLDVVHGKTGEGFFWCEHDATPGGFRLLTLMLNRVSRFVEIQGVAVGREQRGRLGRMMSKLRTHDEAKMTAKWSD